MRILVSGFEKFGEHTDNPTEYLIRSIQNGGIIFPHGLDVRGIVLPVTFKSSYVELQNCIKAYQPDIVLSFGLAEKRETIEFERVSINYIDAPIPDNGGSQPNDKLIDANGQTAYFSTLPIKRLETALRNENIITNISNSAGTYVCNYVFYQMMKNNPERKCGFIHVPKIPTSELVNVLNIILKELSLTKTDT